MTRDCLACGAIKPLDQFDVKLGGKMGRHSRCKACRVIERRLDREKQRERARAWYEINRERVIASVSERRRERPHLHREAHARRRALKAGTRLIETIDRLALIARDEQTCHLCGGFVPLERLHLDHVIPLARGGAHTADNLRVAHASCNLSKGVRLPSELAALGGS